MRFEFRRWVSTRNLNDQVPFILFGDEVTFGRNNHQWCNDNQDAVIERNFQERFWLMYGVGLSIIA